MDARAKYYEYIHLITYSHKYVTNTNKQIKRQQDNDQSFDMQSSDLMRARCTVPRDPVVLYEGMRKAGLQYGPSFRLLSQVWIPESTHMEQCRAVDEENADPVSTSSNIETAN